MEENKQISPFEELIGLQVDRVHAVPSAELGYKSITLCFHNGKSICFAARINTSRERFLL